MKQGKCTKQPMTLTSTASTAFEKVFLDLVGPLDRDENGNCYILTLQCELTKYIEAYPLPNKEAVTVPEAYIASTSNSRKRNLTEKLIEQWLEEDNEHEFSDVDDEVADQHFTIEEEEHVASEISEVEEIEIETSSEGTNRSTNTPDSNRNRYRGKNGFVWSVTDFLRTSRTLARNIVSLPRQNPDHTRFPGYEALWLKLFDDNMIETIVSCTNKKLEVYRRQFSNYSKHELRDTNAVEIRSLFGLLYYSSVFKCNDADSNYLFATDGTGHEIFRCVMSKYRFNTLLNCLRLDNIDDRQERLETDPLAAVSGFFDKFIANCQANYTPGPYTCVDEMLLAFKGRCKFVIYMPKKPAKYGIKIMVLSDARESYVYNAYIYHGKGSDGVGLPEAEKKLSVPTQSVLRLIKPIENTNRNVTADNWFSSIPLAEMLLKKGLTYLGTLKKNKREIPPEFMPSKNRAVESSLHGFTKDLTLLSFVPKKDKAVILISSCHHSASTDTETRKPTIIVDYNHTKGGVDEIDKKCAIYSCSRKTRRWPQAIFYRVLDIAGINAYVLYGQCEGTKLRRGDFLMHLSRELVLPALKQRVYNEKLPRELRLTLRRVLGQDLPPPPLPESSNEPSTSSRKLCRICPSKLKRQTRFVCCICAKHICLQCSSQICVDCKTEL
ncbi:unnamed protein product [Parnassius mnemosyne]|uniref:PiggyBac transposable element-derived protein domain-containing protein n=1 Tax=Parnassius mnemosyne TaxID=213953 RepID=A0AAV1LAE9_9NEOP